LTGKEDEGEEAVPCLEEKEGEGEREEEHLLPWLQQRGRSWLAGA
jgi:hypothetical protein